MKKIGLFLSATHDWQTVKRLAFRAEELDYHSVWFGDHIALHGSRFECWTILSALAPQLKTLRIGPLVLSNSFRNPALVAKMAATLDVISDGRLEMGIGAGWRQREYEAYGYQYPRPAVRIRQMEEGIRILKLMWTEDNPSFKGKYFWIRDSVCDPKPIQKPYPPITVGGWGEKLTLKVVAKEADRCNFYGAPKQYEHLLGVLRDHCKTVGRNFEEIEKSLIARVYLFKSKRRSEDRMKEIYETSGSRLPGRDLKRPFDEWLNAFKNRSIVGTVDDCIQRLKAYDPLGVTCYTLRFEDLPHGEGFELFNEHVLNEIR